MAAGRVNASGKPELHNTSRKVSVLCDGGAVRAKRDVGIVIDESSNAWGGEVMDVDLQSSVPPSPKRRKISQHSDKDCCESVPISKESPVGSISSLSYQTCGSGEREPGQLDEDDFSNTPNIMTSRWASDDDLLDETLNEEEKKEAKSSGGSLGSGESYIQSSENEDGIMVLGDIDSNDDQLTHDDLESSDEDEKSIDPTCGQPSRNMLQASRSVFDYDKLGRISEGSYGVVFKARDKETGEVVALKKLKMAKEREGFPLHYLREINMMLSFNHPSIVNVKEVVVDESDEGFGNVFMVMEHMEHDLKELMQSRKEAYSPSEVKCLMMQLLEGVKYLHDNWVLHRDLKTSNLLVNNQGQLKICDFGMSRQYGSSPLKPYTSLVVTLWYRAPELLLGDKEYSTAVDMWSVGCIMAELLTNKPLFDGENEVQQLDKIFRLLGTPNEKIWPDYSQLPGAKASFVSRPYKLHEKFPRPLFTGSPVLTNVGLDLLNKLLTYDPKKRITAEEALCHPWFSEVPLPKSKEFMPTFPVHNSSRR